VSLKTGLEKLEDCSEPKCIPDLLANMTNLNSSKPHVVSNFSVGINKSIQGKHQEAG
jgi:hypothetical protein